MEGFRQPKVGNFIPDRMSDVRWQSGSRTIETWRCVVCGTPGIRDRIIHNTKGCAPVGWLDPLGVLVETVFALWGPDAPDVVQAQLPAIPEGKNIKVADLPYFTKAHVLGEWLVIGHKEYMQPGALVEVNVRGTTSAPVYIEDWRFERKSPRTGNTYIMATYRSAGKD